jgi:hypothetical protein
MKIFRDTLMNDKGKYSAKRITALASFIMACALPMYSLYKGNISTEIIMLAGEFLTSALVCLGISSWQKTKLANNAEEV